MADVLQDSSNSPTKLNSPTNSVSAAPQPQMAGDALEAAKAALEAEPIPLDCAWEWWLDSVSFIVLK